MTEPERCRYRFVKVLLPTIQCCTTEWLEWNTTDGRVQPLGHWSIHRSFCGGGEVEHQRCLDMHKMHKDAMDWSRKV